MLSINDYFRLPPRHFMDHTLNSARHSTPQKSGSQEHNRQGIFEAGQLSKPAEAEPPGYKAEPGNKDQAKQSHRA